MEENNSILLNKQQTIFNEEYTKFIENNNNAAGTRARKALLEIGKLTKVIRKEIQDKKNVVKE